MPAPETRLKYTIDPRNVYYTRDTKNPSLAMLTISVSNITDESIKIDGFEVAIPVSTDPQSENALCADTSSILPDREDKRNWFFDGKEGRYRAEPATASVVVAPQQSLTFYLKNITVNNKAGTVLIDITEKCGDDVATISKQVAKIKSDLDINRFAANPADMGPSDSSVLSWSTTAAARVTLSPGDFPGIKPNDSVTVNPAITTTYTLTAYGEGPNISALANININPPVIQFSATKQLVNAGETITLNWDVANAKKVFISFFGSEEFHLKSSKDVQITNTTSFTLRAADKNGNTLGQPSTITVRINPVKINSFTATRKGYGATELSWDMLSAVSARIETTEVRGIKSNDIAYNIPADKLNKGTYTLLVPTNKEKHFVLTANNELGGDSANADINTVTSGLHKLDTPLPITPDLRNQVYKFNNKIYLLNGTDTASVYTTTDCINWVKEPGDFKWAQRQKAVFAVFNNKVWMLGGLTYEVGAKPCNDVWSSADGKTWVQETAAAPWAGRHSFGAFVAPGTSKLCIIGGLKDGADPFNDMWSTTDGKNWVKETDAAFATPRQFMATTVLNNKVWLVATNLNEPPAPVSFWQSSDGKTWQKIGAKGDLIPKTFSNAFAISGTLYTLSIEPSPEVFMSTVIGVTSIAADGSFSSLAHVSYDDLAVSANFIEYNGCLWAMNIFRARSINDKSYGSTDIWVYTL